MDAAKIQFLEEILLQIAHNLRLEWWFTFQQDSDWHSTEQSHDHLIVNYSLPEHSKTNFNAKSSL